MHTYHADHAKHAHIYTYTQTRRHSSKHLYIIHLTGRSSVPSRPAQERCHLKILHHPLHTGLQQDIHTLPKGAVEVVVVEVRGAAVSIDLVAVMRAAQMKGEGEGTILAAAVVAEVSAAVVQSGLRV